MENNDVVCQFGHHTSSTHAPIRVASARHFDGTEAIGGNLDIWSLALIIKGRQLGQTHTSYMNDWSETEPDGNRASDVGVGETDMMRYCSKRHPLSGATRFRVLSDAKIRRHMGTWSVQGFGPYQMRRFNQRRRHADLRWNDIDVDVSWSCVEHSLDIWGNSDRTRIRKG